MIKVNRYEVIEIQVPNGSTLQQFQFPDMPQLRDAEILQIEYITAGNTAVSPNTGSALLTDADASKAFVNLYQGSLQRVKNMPLLKLNPLLKNASNNVNAYEPTLFDNVVISWTKCFVKFYSVPATTNVVIAFGVTYLQKEDAGYKGYGQSL